MGIRSFGANVGIILQGAHHVVFLQELECETSEKGLQQSSTRDSPDHQKHGDISNLDRMFSPYNPECLAY